MKLSEKVALLAAITALAAMMGIAPNLAVVALNILAAVLGVLGD